MQRGACREDGILADNSRHAMPQTIRQRMIDILMEGPASAKNLSARIGIREKEVLPHLEHIRKSLQHHNQRLLLEPASCQTCGFAFHKRDRLSKPGRCPTCRSTSIEEPLFMIR